MGQQVSDAIPDIPFKPPRVDIRVGQATVHIFMTNFTLAPQNVTDWEYEVSDPSILDFSREVTYLGGALMAGCSSNVTVRFVGKEEGVTVVRATQTGPGSHRIEVTVAVGSAGSRAADEKELGIDPKLFQVPAGEPRLIREIYNGGERFASVHEATYRGERVAYKFADVDLTTTTTDQIDEFTTEVRLLQLLESLGHPNIVDFVGAVWDRPRVAVLTKYCPNGDIANYIKNPENPRLSMEQKIKILLQICSVMTCLHDHGELIHGSLAPRNILLDESLNVKLTGFIKAGGIDARGVRQCTSRGICGVSKFIAPEVLLTSLFGKRSDIYSFGILMYVLLTEDFEPFGPQPEEEQPSSSSSINLDLRIARNPTLRPRFPEGLVLRRLASLAARCWDGDRANRPASFSEVADGIMPPLLVPPKVEVQVGDSVMHKYEEKLTIAPEFRVNWRYEISDTSVLELRSSVSEAIGQEGRRTEVRSVFGAKVPGSSVVVAERTKGGRPDERGKFEVEVVVVE